MHLLELDDAALRQRWTTIFKADPSPNFRRLLMVRSIAYRLQEKTLDSLKKSAERLLDQISDAPAEDALKRGFDARILSSRPARLSLLQKRPQAFLLIHADEALRRRFVLKHQSPVDVDVPAAGNAFLDTRDCDRAHAD
jgi:Protein of unknown function (DUF2924)